MAISKILDVSTVHIKKETSEWINSHLKSRGDDISEGLVAYKKLEYGWFIHVGEYTRDFPESVPSDLHFLFWFAHQKGCEWLMLDSDGNAYEDLPRYDWR